MAVVDAEGGDLDETYEEALNAIGEQDRSFGAPDYREGDEEEEFDRR